jgi:uncharacterized protein (TIGR04222 family)
VANPFDLAGPQFLVFYALFGAMIVAALWMARRWFESGSYDAPMIQNYLEIAYLRGGSSEALKVATMSLVNRGLIEIVDEDRLRTKDTDATRLAGQRLERSLLQKFTKSDRASTVFADPAMQELATEECEPGLVRFGLLPDEQAQARRRGVLAVAAFALVAVAGTKTLVALSRGRTNILLLVVEAVVLLFIAYKLTSSLRTLAGDAQLSYLRSMFGGLRDRASSLAHGGEGQDLALLAAVFGAGAVPSRFGFDRLFPRARDRSSGCGSSCGAASSCGSGGSSCGGGGGGCGGCGS